MKKNICVILIVSTLLLLMGCNKSLTSNNPPPKVIDNSQTEGNESKLKIENYYPFQKDVKYMYVGTGNEFATYSVQVDYLKENHQQIRVNNGGTEMAKVLEIKDGELRLVFSKGESYYREDFTTKTNDKAEVLLKEPLTKGNSWTLADGGVRTITNVKTSITTPAGSYECLEVTTVGKDSTIKDYYAADVGLAKTVFISNGTEVSSSLSKIEKNVPFVQTVKFYYPNGDDGFNYITNKQISFNTNDITRETLEKSFKEVTGNELGKVLSPNAKIKSLYLNQDNIVYIDFSGEFTKEMNAGSGYESQILQCVTNTIGDYYKVQKVYITVEGEPYSSGHIAMKKGEAFMVDYTNNK
ncbi:GerMN domain-containing protein [Clostridium sp. CS001]|uniref:GerMN domain-containing protein n=1 Tax=Clostridium sp. CS001 TaxID=2880648 RepID=UPI001CF5381C|nr:GerMN domain-containing protein [Clostridium sp. CS001]MCB2288259.1 GerMN domain-containing protein [Clostridium sp. CS001]